MALNPIIIPSKNIYRKDNQKVITNLIDKIEVQSKRVVPDNHYNEAVYNEAFKSEPYITGTAQPQVDIHFLNNMTLKKIDYACAYVYIQPYYCTQSITIPKIADIRHIITSILSGVDENNNPNIHYSTECEVLEGTASARYTTELKDLIVNYPNPTGTPKRVEIPKKVTKYEPHTAFNGSDLSATAVVTLDDETNLGTITIQENNDSFTFTCTVLCGAEVYEMSGSGYSDEAPGFPISGTATKYIPYSVTITVYGNTIGIDLQDNTLSISNGKNTYSFSGNELMQDSNTPSVKDTYSKVITQYKDGKEIAELKVNIDDYYDTEGNLIISPRTQWIYDKPYTIKLLKKISPTVYYVTARNKITGEGEHIGDGILIFYEDEYAVCEGETPQGEPEGDELTVTANGEISKLLDTVGELVVNVDDPPRFIPMTFHIGDTVIPYIYTAKGVDKPMSYYIDNTPKEFVIVGKGISYRGRAYQKLTLQEVTKEIDT